MIDLSDCIISNTCQTSVTYLGPMCYEYLAIIEIILSTVIFRLTANFFDKSSRGEIETDGVIEASNNTVRSTDDHIADNSVIARTVSGSRVSENK